jgi:glycerate kinase
VNFLVAPDSFKGSLTALQAADAMEQGIREVMPEAEIATIPLADGGEGTAEALVMATRGRMEAVTVTGPMGEPVQAQLGLLGDDVTAVVECAQAVGLPLVPPAQRNPLVATSRGVGELIGAALDRHCARLIVGLGGSATNDGGAGLAQALGVRLLDARGAELGPGGARLAELDRIDVSRLDPRLAEVTVWAASDVTNPLCGPEGASAIYGPQKGATPEMVGVLDAALGHYAEVIARDVGKEVREAPGAGAAGGLGAAMLAFCGATIRSGAGLVLEMFSVEELLEAADVVFTGEGRLDAQIEFGKAVGVIARRAQQYGVPVIAFAGNVQAGPARLAECGITSGVPIVMRPVGEEQAMAHAGELLQAAVARTVRLLQLGREVGRKWGD